MFVRSRIQPQVTTQQQLPRWSGVITRALRALCIPSDREHNRGRDASHGLWPITKITLSYPIFHHLAYCKCKISNCNLVTERLGAWQRTTIAKAGKLPLKNTVSKEADSRRRGGTAKHRERSHIFSEKTSLALTL